VVLERVVDRGQVSQRLMRPPEIVFHQPLGEVAVEEDEDGIDEFQSTRPARGATCASCAKFSK